MLRPPPGLPPSGLGVLLLNTTLALNLHFPNHRDVQLYSRNPIGGNEQGRGLIVILPREPISIKTGIFVGNLLSRHSWSSPRLFKDIAEGPSHQNE
jgi:hypothetical protein